MRGNEVETTEDPPPGRQEETLCVYVAACTGSARLSHKVGLPIVHIDVTSDVGASITLLNAVRHGCGALTAEEPHELDVESGWTDWAACPLDPRIGALAATKFGVRTTRRHFIVSLPAGITPAEFRAQLAGTLRHLRLQEATIRTDFLQARSNRQAESLVSPRYTPTRLLSIAFRDAELVEDLFIIDPAERGGRLFWLIVAARAATIAGSS